MEMFSSSEEEGTKRMDLMRMMMKALTNISILTSYLQNSSSTTFNTLQMNCWMKKTSTCRMRIRESVELWAKEMV